NRDYPVSIANDGDAKTFYGSIITILSSKKLIEITAELEETVAQEAERIKQAISDYAKRDWKHNEVVHKQIHRALDDCLFDLCDHIGLTIDKTNVDIIDLMIEEIMKVALVRF
ncbi:MAG: type I restriction endonuclease subunit R, partial [Clostridia bacterium]|nr:type I restriction endonuclease subunit R [Clostridia bacterium]